MSILTVGAGGTYSTIQAAVNAANDGDTIVVEAGTYVETLNVDKDVTILGPNSGIDGTASRSAEAVIDGQITISASGVTIDGVRIVGDAPGSLYTTAVEVHADGFTLSNSVLDGDGAIAIITGSVSGLDVSHNLIQGYAIGAYVSGPASSGSIHDNRFQGAGGGATGLGNGVNSETSHVTIEDNVFDGLYAGSLNLFPFGPEDLDLDSYISGNTITNSGIARPVQILPTGSTHSMTGTDFNEAFDGETAAGSYGVSGAFSFDGQGGDDRAWGAGEGDTLAGGSGMDQLFGNGGGDSLDGGTGDDLLEGGSGNDTLAGGDDEDVAVYAGPRSGYAVTTITDSSGRATGFSAVTDTDAGNGDEGSDTLSGVEKLQFAGVTLDLAKPVQLFDSGNALVGTFDTIQAAIDASSNGDSILVAAGTYNEVINVNKDVTIAGPNAGKAGSDGTRGAEAVIKGAYMSADGATLDGLKVAYDGTLVAGNPTGILVANDGVTLTNLVIDGIDQSASSGITTPFNGGVTGLAISNNLITDFFWGAYLNPTTVFTATGNTFTSNTAVDIAGDDWAPGTQIGGNNFPDSITHIGYSTDQTNFDFDQFLVGAPNAFGGTGRAISVTGRGDGDAGGQSLHGTAYNDSLNDSSTAPSGLDGTLDGEGGDDRLTGNAGNDLLIGGTGNDILRGGTGTDTASYTDAITAAGIAAVADGDPSAAGAQPGWTVTTATEGTDSLTGVEIVDGAEVGKFLLVGSGGFATIQQAVDAAADGDTILVAAGTYNETVNVNKDVTILGPNAGVAGTGTRGAEAVVTAFYISAAGATLDGLKVLNGAMPGGNASGIFVNADDVTLTNLVVQGQNTAGMPGIVTPYNGGITGLTLSNSLVTGWAQGAYFNPTTGFTATGNSFDGNGNAILGDDWDDATLIANNSFTNSVGSHIGYGVLDTVDDVGAYFGTGNVFGGTNRPTSIFAYGDGTPAAQTVYGTELSNLMRGETAGENYVFHGRNGNDRLDGNSGHDTLYGDDGSDDLRGMGGNDTLDGGDGNDVMAGGTGDDLYFVDDADVINESSGAGTDEVRTDLYEHTLAANVENLTGGSDAQILTGNGENNVIDGGGDNDVIDGAGGIDTARYAGPATITEHPGGWTVVDAGGTDTLSNVEQVDDGAPGKTLLVGNGGYGSIQAAIDAASDGDTILVASGTYVENLNVNKDVTILGPNHGIAGTAARGAEAVIDGQIVINAAGATLDGFRLVGDDAGTLGSSAIEVRANNFTLSNSVLDGSGDFAVFVGLVTGLDMGRNLVRGYGVGAYVSGGNTTGSIHDNRFQGNGGPATGMANGVNSETSHVAIANNIFDGLYSGSLTLFPFGPDTVDLQSYVTGNTITNTPVARPVQIYPTDLTHNILGTDFNESYIGDWGVTGPLSFDGRGGDDKAWGSEQGDTLAGGTGADELFGNGGDDNLSGGDQNDTLHGGAGNDTADGGNNNDVVNGGDGDDILSGGAGVDTLNGGNDNDSLEGGSGNDTLNGEDGNDTMRGGAGNDALNGGAGTDTAVYDHHRGDYSIGMITGAGGRIVGFSSVSDNEPSNGNDGADAFTSVERVQFSNRTLDATLPVQLFDQANQLIGTFTTIQAAIDSAQDNYTIRVAAGTFDEDLVIDKGVQILGARQSVAGTALPPARDAADGVGETTIVGHAKVTAEDNVILNGLRFLNDATTTGGGASNPTLQFLTGGGSSGHLVSNTIFWSTVAGGANGVDDRAVSAPLIADGKITFDNNLISGSSQGLFSTASWGRGIWLDGGGIGLSAEGNIVEWTRSGVVLDGVGGSFYFLAGNILRNLGTAFSIATTEDGLALNNNHFTNVGDEYNFRNLSQDILFDASFVGGTLTPVGNSNDALVILGGSGDDTLTGTSGVDYIDANNRPGNLTVADTDTLNGGGGNDFLFGRFGTDTLNGGTGQDSLDGGDGNDILNGDADNDSLAGGAGDDSLNGGSGDDSLDGGSGVDTAVVGSGATYTPTGTGWTVTSSDGTDTLTGVEIVDSGPGPNTLLVGSGGFATIQEAVNAAQDGDTILVSAGTYVEQVTVNNLDNLTIVAVTGAQVTIKAPADLVETARSSSDREVHAVLTAKDSLNLNLQNIDIDGDGRGHTVDEGGGTGQANFYGIFYRNSSGGLLNVDITGVRDPYPGGTAAGGEPLVSGVQRGVGLVVDNNTLLAFSMSGGSISDFQKNATSFNRADLSISGVVITGGGAQTGIAQNGIQVSNSTGSISANTIQGIGYAGPADAASGAILAFGNTNLTIAGNLIVGANVDDTAAKVVGIWVFQSGAPNSGGMIAGNSISHVDEGIDVTGDVTPNGILIQSNSVDNIDDSDFGPVGVYFAPNPALTTAHDVDGSDADDVLSGGAGNDTLSGLDGSDVLTGNGGDDTLGGGDGDDVAVYQGPRSGYSVAGATDGSGRMTSFTTVDDIDTGNGDQGTDTLTGVERLQFGNVTLDLADPVQLFDGGGQLVGTFDTIQAAVDAAASGYTVRVAAGTYAEIVTVDEDVTILGPNVGILGSGVRGAEAVVDGFYMHSAGATLDGLKILGGGTIAGNPAGIYVDVDGVTLANLVVEGDGTANPGILTPYGGGVTGLTLTRSLITGWGQGTYFNPTTGFTASDNSFDGNGNAIVGDDWDDATLLTGNSFTNSVGSHIGYGVLDTVDDVGAYFGAGNTFGGTNRPTSIFAYGDGTPSGQTVYGTELSNLIRGETAGESYTFHGRGGDDRLVGNNGDDTFNGGTGNDTIVGGDGIDTAVFADPVTVADIAAVADADPSTPGNQPGWTVTTSEGTDSLSGIEIIDGADGDILFVGDGGFATIQAAIDAAHDGDTILVAAGTYVEQLTIADFAGLTLMARPGATVVVKAPAVLAVNGVSETFNEDVRAVIAVNDSTEVTISGIDVDGSFAGDTTPGSNGDELTGIGYFNSSGSIADVAIDNVGNSQGGGLFGLQHGSGLFVDAGSTPDLEVSVTGVSITDFQKTGAIIYGVAVNFTGNTITGIGGTDLTAQNGLQIANSEGVVDGNTISGFGYSGPIFSGTGIIAYEPTGPLAITDNVITGAGAAGSAVGLDLSDVQGVEVEVTGNSFNDLDFGIAAYSFLGGTIGLDTDPLMSGNTFSNIALLGVYFAPEESVVGDFSTTENFTESGSQFDDYLAGSLGNDNFSGLAGDDVLTGNGGNDILDGDGGIDVAIYSGPVTVTQNGASWTVTGEGTDTLTDIEIIDDGSGSVILLVGNGGYATIQEAIDAAQAGDTILVASGTYVEDLDVNKDVTILGPNHGILGTGSRGAEAVIDGQVAISAAGVTIDGVKIVGDAPGSVPPNDVGVDVMANNFTLTNSVLQGSGDSAIYLTQAFGLEVSNNLISGYSNGVGIFSGNSTGSIHDNLFQGDGGPATGLRTGVVSQSTHVLIADNVFDGIYSNSLVLFPHGVSGTVDLTDYVDNNTISDSGVPHPVEVVPGPVSSILGTDHAEEFVGQEMAMIGITGAWSFDGRGGDDLITGGEDGDTFIGGSGSDQLLGFGGDDLLTGGGDDDSLGGGDGFDTANYAGPVSDYTVTYTTDGAGRVTGFSSVVDNVPAGGDEGSDTLTSIEALSFGGNLLDLGDPVQLFDSNGNLVGTFDSIQEAIDSASDDYTIRVAAGTYDEDLTIDVGVAILGAEVGEAVAGRDAAGGAGETTIVGHAQVTAADNVTLDGLRFLNDGTTTGGGSANPTLQFLTGGGATGHLVTNSIFWSTVTGGSADDRAISTVVIADGSIAITDNLISGTSQGQFGTASWGRAVWFDGGGVDLVVTGNKIEWSRTGLNLDMSGNSTADVTDNSFEGLGTAIALGIDADGLTVSSNDIKRVGTEFSFRNLATPVSFNAGTAIGTLVPVGDPNDLVVVLGGSGNDSLTGTAGADVLDGNNSPTAPAAADDDVLSGLGGADVLFGRGGNDMLDGGTGDDSMTGGTGNDIYVVDSAGDSITEASGEGTDEVRTSLASYTLAAALENLTGLGNVNQTLNGNSSDNVIDGGLGADAMTGGVGNDTYVVDNAGDTVTELAGEGTDEIRTSLASYSLAALANVENLTGTSGAGQTLTGNGSANVVTGAGGNDVIDGAAGADTMRGNGGNDLYFVDNAGDVVTENPGEGTDEVRTGLAAYTLAVNVENLTATSDVNHDFRDNSGNNVVTGGAGHDLLWFLQGGIDTGIGGSGNDVFLFGSTMDGLDAVDGGAGTDQIALQGGSAFTFGSGVVGVESIGLLSGSDTRFGGPGGLLHSYDLTTLDVNVAAGALLTVDGAKLLAGENLTFDGSAESNGSFFIYAGRGVDTLTGGAGNDVFLFGSDGHFGASDVVDGGSAGIDQLALRGSYTLTFGAGQMTGIESLGLLSAQDTRYGPLGSNYNYNLTMHDGNLAAGVQMTVDGAKLRGSETLVFNGAAELDGSFRIIGGINNDTLTGSQNGDILQGKVGADMLTGNGGADIFRYDTTADSDGLKMDRILDFTPGTDRIDLARIDANSLAAGDQAFTWIGTGAFTGVAGQLRAMQSGSDWFLLGDTNGDSMPEFVVQLTLQGPTPLSAGDFIL